MHSLKLAQAAPGWAFTSAAGGYWLEVFPYVYRELCQWRRLADTIPDPVLRRDALDSLVAKHRNAEGAAAFAILAPRRQRPRVGRLLVALQSMFDFLDTLSEQPARDPLANGRQLHAALTIALTPGAAHVDYYAEHPRGDDGGFLRAYVERCQGLVAGLPTYAVAEPGVHAAVALAAEGQSLNHAGLYATHDALARWARAQTPVGVGLAWWEVASAAVSTLTIHALLAAAADPALTPTQAARLSEAYFPWITGFGTLLDSVVDRLEDEHTGNHSQIGYYRSEVEAAERLGLLAERSLALAAGLDRGDRHQLIVAAMACYYLAAPAAESSEARVVALRVLDALGPLAPPALRVFRLRQLAGRGAA
jgi:tetraprenyl-beta-curcumene synthase